MQHQFFIGNYGVGLSLRWFDIPQTIFSLAVVNETSGTMFEFGIFGAVARLIVCVVRCNDG